MSYGWYFILVIPKWTFDVCISETYSRNLFTERRNHNHPFAQSMIEIRFTFWPLTIILTGQNCFSIRTIQNTSGWLWLGSVISYRRNPSEIFWEAKKRWKQNGLNVLWCKQLDFLHRTQLGCGRLDEMWAEYFYLVKHDFVLGLEWFSLLSIGWIAIKLYLYFSWCQGFWLQSFGLDHIVYMLMCQIFRNSWTPWDISTSHLQL